MTRTWALIPVKDFSSAKSRLATALSAPQRRTLAQAMARDVVAALHACSAVEQIVLVSDIPSLDRCLHVSGVVQFDTGSARGLNEDLTRAALWAGEEGANQVLIVHADLPLLSAEAVDRFVDSPHAPPERIRAAACKQDRGTNLLLAPIPLPLPLVFGDNSLDRFCRCAAAAGVALDLVRDPALAADIDDVEDLRRLLRVSGSGVSSSRWASDFRLAASNSASVSQAAVARWPLALLEGRTGNFAQ